MECPKCNGIELTKFGMTHRKGGKVQRYRCNTCNTVFINGEFLNPRITIPINVTPEVFDMIKARAHYEQSPCGVIRELLDIVNKVENKPTLTPKEN